jgi:putative endopeptidase
MSRFFVMALFVCLVGCATSGVSDAPGGTTGNLSSGLVLENFDKSVRPQDDLYRFANGQWLDTFEIPADKSSFGAFTHLYDESQDNLKAIISDASEGKLSGDSAKKVGDAYAAFMNDAAIEAAGLSALQKELSTIAGLKTHQDIGKHFLYLQELGVKTPFGGWVDQDHKNTTSYILYMTQSGLGLPDRDYYFKEEEKFQKIRAGYEAYLVKIFTLLGRSDAGAQAASVVAIEKSLASKHWTRVQNRDRNKTYNKLTIDELANMLPDVPLKAWNDSVDGALGNVVIRQPDYFGSLAQLMTATDVRGWKAYCEAHLVTLLANRMPSAFVEAHFGFYGKVLRGIKENRPRWKRGVSEVESMLGEVLGQVYVERHFKPEAKARMESLVGNLTKSFEKGIDELAWMTPPTKVHAQAKLKKFVSKIGYPTRWRDYSSLVIKNNDPVGNFIRARLFQHHREMAKLGKPIDREEWFMNPQTVNAYYNPSMNEIVFPAAILQPPFFNLQADDAVNYGGIGAVIGHEFSHGFDDQGRKSDGDGMLRDWWTEEDAKEFKRRADLMIAQYAKFSPIEGTHVNGELTLGENIGDLGGLTIAYKAYKLSLNGKASPVIDGFTGEQRFFLGWAQSWACKYREAALRQRLMTDPHSPAIYRVLGVVANMPEFYEAFGVKPGDGLYQDEDKRVKIW